MDNVDRKCQNRHRCHKCVIMDSAAQCDPEKTQACFCIRVFSRYSFGRIFKTMKSTMFILMEPHKNSNAHRIRQAVLKMFALATPNLSIRK